MFRFFFFLLGFGLMVSGLTYTVTYLNLMSMGYNLKEYFLFILKRGECLIAIIGFIIVTTIILTGGSKENDLYI